MAGSYPDVPGPQMLYDRDGSAGVFINAANVSSNISTANLQALNGTVWANYNGGQQDTTGYVCIIFPELRDLVGVLIFPTFTATMLGFHWSADTTNGLDGTWTNVPAVVTAFAALAQQPAIPTFRTSITAVALTGVKAVRYYGRIGSINRNLALFHIYGTIPATSTPTRLRLWHPTLDQELGGAWFDFGNVARGGPAIDKQFRVKNNAAALTANTVNVATSALADANPTVVSQLTLNYNGGAFGATATGPATLAAGAISNLFTLRYTPSATAAIALWRQRLVATAASFA